MRGSSCRMERVWRNLPSDLLEKVVTLLPIACLCRFRAVSKKWNRLICHPDFASRHAQASPPEEYVLITARDDIQENSCGGWEVLDVANKRFFTLSADFLDEFIKQGGFTLCPQHPELFSLKSILAADGGLLCLLYFFYHECDCERRRQEALLVCNPVLKTVKQLQLFAGFSQGNRRVVMSTDRISMEYEIFIIHLADDDFRPGAFHIYESKTASWRASFPVPGHLNAFIGDSKIFPISTVLEGEFYALFIHRNGLHPGFISYNKVTGAVSDLGIEDPGHDYSVSLQLVVSDNRRVFFVVMKSGVDPMMHKDSIEIVEFILARKEYIQFSVLRGELLHWVLGEDGYARGGLYDDEAPAVAIGLANSILFCSFAGRSLAFNLANRTWHKYPDINFLRGAKDLSDIIFGSNHCLSLCAP